MKRHLSVVLASAAELLAWGVSSQRPQIAAPTSLPSAQSADVPFGALPPPCTPTITNSWTYEGAPAPEGNFIWFYSRILADGGRAGAGVIDFTDGEISFAFGGVPYSLPVPDARIEFNPSASCISTSFDSATQTWKTVAPVASTDTIFMTGLAWPVPSDASGPGTARVSFSGTYRAEVQSPGISIRMQWNSAAYSSVTTAYHALQISAENPVSCGPGFSNDFASFRGLGLASASWRKYLLSASRRSDESTVAGHWSDSLDASICP